MLRMQELFFWVGRLIVSDAYIFAKGKRINAKKNENVESTPTQVFCGRLCVCVTKNKTVLVPQIPVSKQCSLETADQVQNADCRLRKKYRLRI